MKIIQPTLPQNEKKKVCCYARVSTLEDEQTSSYEGQISYYETLIKSNPEWIYAGTFSTCTVR